jgi:glycosyltransferase involved in cell wall biosynthesis
MAEFWEWDSSIKVGSHHYAKHFLNNGHQVFWIPSYWTIFTPFFNWYGFKKRFYEWKEQLFKTCHTTHKNLYSYSPFSILTYRNYPVLNKALIAEKIVDFTLPSLTNKFSEMGWRSIDFLWLANLALIGLEKRMEYKKLIYRMADNMTAFPDVPHTYEKLERKIIEKSDVVIATARYLYDKAKKLNRNVIYLPNGTDFVFQDKRTLREPDDLHIIPHPRVVYVGSTRNWLDYELLENLAHKLDMYSFVIIGPGEDAGLKGLKKYKNIHILGPRLHEEISIYLKYCDVGIIPFKKNELTERVNPIKLYEYFSSGIPVVATNLEEIRYLRSPALLATGTTEFGECLEAAYQMGKNKVEFREFAERHTWSNRYTRLMEYLMK